MKHGALLLVSLAALSCAKRLNPAFNPQLIDQTFFCPKAFVPGRPGGFLKAEGAQACCVAGTGIALLEIIYAIHKCKRYSTRTPNLDWSAPDFRAIDKTLAHDSCDGHAMRSLNEWLGECCRSKNAASKLDFTEDDADCLDAVHESQKSIATKAVPAFSKCVAATRAGGGAAECKAAGLAAIGAMRVLMGDARKLYDRGSAQDYTRLSRRWVGLCEGLNKAQCFGRLRIVIRDYHLNYAW